MEENKEEILGKRSIGKKKKNCHCTKEGNNTNNEFIIYSNIQVNCCQELFPEFQD